MKLRKLITALLITLFLLIPVHRTQAPPRNPIFGCVALAVGAVVVIGLVYVCKKLPPMPGTCNCGCSVANCSCKESSTVALPGPPVGQILTNPPASQATMLPKLDYNGYAAFGSGSMVDDQGNQWNYESAFKLALQTSVDLTDWQYLFTINGWLTTDGGALVSVRSNGVTIVNAYFEYANDQPNAVPIDLPGGSKRFYRISCE